MSTNEYRHDDKWQPNPTSDYIRVMRKRNVGWAAALSELIDNSIGKRATAIDVLIDNASSVFRIRDNGVGCTKDMFKALGTIGKHVEDPEFEDDISMHGIGAKDAVLWLSSETTYCSVRPGVGYLYAHLNWINDWNEEKTYPCTMTGEIAKQLCVSAGIQGAHGVVVVCHRIQQSLYPKEFQELCKRLQQQFTVAIEQGVSILLTHISSRKIRSHIKLQPKRLPCYMSGHSIDSVVTIDDERQIRICAGVIDNDERIDRAGFEYIRGHRVIGEAGGHGAGGRDYSRIYGRVWLLGAKHAWGFDTAKSVVSVDSKQILESIVYRECEHLFDVSEQQPFARYQADKLLAEASDLLNAGAEKVGRQKRNQTREHVGAVPPVGTDRKIKTAARVNGNGVVRERNSNGRSALSYIDLKWKTYPEDQAGKIGHVDMSARQHVIWLNEEHPFLVWCREQQNVVAIAVVASSLWAARNTFYTGDNQGCLQYGDDPPEPKWQRKLSQMLIKVGNRHKSDVPA